MLIRQLKPSVSRGGRPSGQTARTMRSGNDADFDEVYISQAGGEHDGFFEFYAHTVLPRLRDG